MAELRVSLLIDAPADRVWAAVTDWAAQGGWIPATRVAVTRGSGAAVGDRVVARTAVAGIGFDDPMEITAWEPPRRCDVLHLGRVVRGTGTFAVDPVGERSARFTWSEQVDVPLGAAGAVAFRIARPLLELMFRMALRRLAATVVT